MVYSISDQPVGCVNTKHYRSLFTEHLLLLLISPSSPPLISFSSTSPPHPRLLFLSSWSLQCLFKSRWQNGTAEFL